jgi:hypothetical protein
MHSAFWLWCDHFAKNFLVYTKPWTIEQGVHAQYGRCNFVKNILVYICAKPRITQHGFAEYAECDWSTSVKKFWFIFIQKNEQYKRVECDWLTMHVAENCHIQQNFQHKTFYSPVPHSHNNITMLIFSQFIARFRNWHLLLRLPEYNFVYISHFQDAWFMSSNVQIGPKVVPHRNSILLFTCLTNAR